MQPMSVYLFCKERCTKFKKKEEEVLATAESAFDAAYDMRYFVDECSKTCQKILSATSCCSCEVNNVSDKE